MTQTEASAKTYEGGCHCGAVQFQVTGPIEGVATCNCSICSRTGALLAFVPESSFKLLKGENAQTDYQFAKHNIHHLFCSTCGVRSFAHGTGPGGNPMYVVNARVLEGFDPKGLPVKEFDGKSLLTGIAQQERASQERARVGGKATDRGRYKNG